MVAAALDQLGPDSSLCGYPRPRRITKAPQDYQGPRVNRGVARKDARAFFNAVCRRLLNQPLPHSKNLRPGQDGRLNGQHRGAFLARRRCCDLWSGPSRISGGPQEMRFNLNRPSNAIFLISVVLALLSLIGALANVSMLSSNAFLILAIAYVVLVIGNLMKGA